VGQGETAQKEKFQTYSPVNQELTKKEGMKKIILIVSAIFTLLMHCSGSNVYAYSILDAEPIQFYLVDDDGKGDKDSIVKLSYANFTGFSLQYSLTGLSGTWNNYYGQDINTGSNGGELLTWWRAKKGSANPQYYTSGDLYFLAGTGDGLYKSVLIDWDKIGFTLQIANGKDRIKPFIAAVPIPGAVWLLGSGVFGLLMFRGRRKVSMNS
jgi:hypothetical protein